MNRRVLLTCLIVVTSTGSAAAADAGKQIVLQGGSNPGATACVTCHGVDGAGNAAAGFPRLAGLSASYLERQIEAYRLGTRTSAVMAPIAKALTGSESASVSEYYAHQHPPAPQTQARPQRLAAGKRLAITGDWANGIPACVLCHGPAGQGIAGAYFPALAGQHASYIVGQIQAWKNGERRNDPINLMKSVAEALTQEQVEAVAAYFAGPGQKRLRGKRGCERRAPNREHRADGGALGSLARLHTAKRSRDSRQRIRAHGLAWQKSLHLHP
ncbi:MAG: cytochrome c4 [Nitrococcus sp.]|nr:cytochrome c4 [Nitrococcus sp.]